MQNLTSEHITKINKFLHKLKKEQKEQQKSKSQIKYIKKS